MKRRDFLLTTGVAGVASLAGTATAGKGEKQQYLELRSEEHTSELQSH